MSEYGIKITIPDGTPDEQVEHIEAMMDVMRTFGRISGEDVEKSLQPLKDAIVTLKSAKPNNNKGGE